MVKMKMDIFKFQSKLMKYCGIDRYPTFQMKIFLNAVKLFNIFAIFYCIFASVLFAFNSKDIVSIAESMGPTTTSIITITKYIIFAYKSDELYVIMDEVNMLKSKCKFLTTKIQI